MLMHIFFILFFLFNFWSVLYMRSIFTSFYPIQLLLCPSFCHFGGVCCQIVSSRHNRDAALMKSKQYGFLKKTCTVMTLVDMLRWMKEISRDPTLRCRVRLREESVFFRNERSPLTGYPRPVVSPKHVYMRSTTWTQQVACVHVCV